MNLNESRPCAKPPPARIAVATQAASASSASVAPARCARCGAMTPRATAASGGPAASVGAAPRPAVTSAEELARLTAAVGATAERYDRSGELPREGLDAAHRAGVFHAVIGERFGGAQIGAVERLRMVQGLGEGDASVALLVANAIGVHVAQAEADVWPPDRYRELLDALARRPVLVNAARAEPDLGAPARGGLPETTIRRSADGWVLTGRKAYVTGGEGLDYHLVWARTDDPVPRFGHVIVPGTRPSRPSATPP